jgi:hypothetical protein
MRYVAEHPELETRAVTLHARPPPAAPSAGSPPPAPPAGLPARLTPLRRNADPPQRSQTADKQATAGFLARAGLRTALTCACQPDAMASERVPSDVNPHRAPRLYFADNTSPDRSTRRETTGNNYGSPLTLLQRNGEWINTEETQGAGNSQAVA